MNAATPSLAHQPVAAPAERTFVFGASSHLAGTHALPLAAPRDVGFILLNAGVIHRVGPRRFNVKLARDLAAQGFHSLRFDLAGQGDSGRASGTDAYEEQVRADVRAAMDALQAASGVRRFVIAGICSGAQAGLDVALSDERVAGLWMLDGPAYPTFRALLARLWIQWKLAPIDSMTRWLGRIASGAGLRKATPVDKPVSAGNPRGAPTRQGYADALERLDARGVRIYLMYSSDVLWQYSYRNQFRDTFRGRRFVDQVQCERLEEADHTLTLLSVQRDVIGRLRRWALAHW